MTGREQTYYNHSEITKQTAYSHSARRCSGWQSEGEADKSPCLATMACVSVVYLPRYTATFQFCLFNNLKYGLHVTHEIVSTTNTFCPALS